MKRTTSGLVLLLASGSLAGCAVEAREGAREAVMADGMDGVDWKAKLEPARYQVLRERGTERAFSGLYWDHHEPGVYRCAGCGQVLFRAEDKFDSGTGWPSFRSTAEPGAVVERRDESHGMIRTEAVCSRCGGHLGHLFDDGPAPTRQRYCINSLSLEFEPRPEPDREAPATGSGE